MAITGEGASQEFAYTGGMQTLTIPFDGLYKLEVGGSKGYGSYSGNGGYSVGYKEFKKGTVLHICCGGRANPYSENYNGGGAGNSKGPGYSGGGATHIALVTGTIASIGYASFVTNGNGLIVAGGAGGSRMYNDGKTEWKGGSGGGLTGGTGLSDGNYNSPGGSQTAGGDSYNDGSFGTGATSRDYGAGGGGGLYGGGANYGGGGGGSGYIGGVPEITYKGVTYSSSTGNGANADAGKAVITFVKKAFPTIYIGDILVDGMYIGDISVDDVKS